MIDMTSPVMVDLETLGTGNDAAILSIGAVKFNDTDILDEFHVGIDLESCKMLGRQIDPATVMWWLDAERDEARKAWLALEKVDIVSALFGFSQWFGDDSLPLWGNGATFDNVILRSAYDAAGLTYPAKFWHDRCYRTLKALVPDIKIVREGTYHSALDDARNQARHLQEIVAHLNGEVTPPALNEAAELIIQHRNQFRKYQEAHEGKANDATRHLDERRAAAEKADVNRRMADEAETFLDRIMLG